MALDFVRASSDYIQIPGLLGNPAVVTVSVIAASDSTDTFGCELFSIGDSIVLRVDPSGELRGAYYYGSNYETTISSGLSLNDGVYFQASYTCDPGNSRQETYHNGVSKRTDTRFNAISYTLDANTQIGRHGSGGGGLDLDGRVAELGVWTRGLSDAEHATLGAGYSPLMIPRGLILYADLIRGVVDIVGNATMTVSGMTVVPHPRVIRPARSTNALVSAGALGSPANPAAALIGL